VKWLLHFKWEETMNIGPDAARKAASLTKTLLRTRELADIRQPQPCMTRRQFARTAAGTAVLGGALGTGFLKPALADNEFLKPALGDNWSFAPIPISRTPYHVFGPMFQGTPIDAEPSTITNLDGFVGLAYISGMVTRTNTKTGERLRLPFRDSDMRFMKGNFRGTDGNIHQSTFAFV
jgi:hypothetical protein